MDERGKPRRYIVAPQAIMTPMELKEMLAKFDIRPIRGRGQHFLLDESVTREMIEASGAGEGDRIVEIGPGPGILTDALLASGAEVVAVELDRKLCSLLRSRFTSKNFHLIQGDALAISNRDLARSSKLAARSSYKVVANIPYSITSAVIEKFLLEMPKPQSLTLMVQREVADRILAAPGDMSSLAVLAQTLTRSRRVLNVPASAFFPPPKVDSAVIHMDIKNDAELGSFFGAVEPVRYFSMVRTAFAGKRKQLKNTLKNAASGPETLEKAFSKAKIPPQARPEELSVEQWIRLVSLLT